MTKPSLDFRDFPTDFNHPDKIFIGDDATAWDIYPDYPMSVMDYLNMLSENLGQLKDTETIKYRVFWHDHPEYIRLGRYVLESDQEYNKRQMRLQRTEKTKQQKLELEVAAREIVKDIPPDLLETVANMLKKRP